MACALTRSGFDFTAKTGTVVTVKVIADNTKMAGAQYNSQDLTVQQDISTSFTVVQGPALLSLALAGPPEDVEIVEDCGGGQTQHLFGSQGEFHPQVGFTIIGS